MNFSIFEISTLATIKSPVFLGTLCKCKAGRFSAQNPPGTGFFAVLRRGGAAEAKTFLQDKAKKSQKCGRLRQRKTASVFSDGSRFCFIVPFFTARAFYIPLRKSFYQPQQQQTITIAIRMMIQQLLLPKNESKQPIAQPPFTNGRICLRGRKC